MMGLSDSERISMTGSAVLTQYTRDRRTDYGISVAYTRSATAYLLTRVKTSNTTNFKKAFRHAGRLFETARLRQTKSSCKFSADCNSERTSKIGHYLMKLCLKYPRLFFPDTVYMFPLHPQYSLMDFCQTFVLGAAWDRDEPFSFLDQ